MVADDPAPPWITIAPPTRSFEGGCVGLAGLPRREPAGTRRALIAAPNVGFFSEPPDRRSDFPRRPRAGRRAVAGRRPLLPQEPRFFPGHPADLGAIRSRAEGVGPVGGSRGSIPHRDRL